jgi:hypothetical protein
MRTYTQIKMQVSKDGYYKKIQSKTGKRQQIDPIPKQD